MNVEVRSPADAAAGTLTLAIDIGGTGLKGAVLDPSGVPITDRVRVPTPDDRRPDKVVEALAALTGQLGRFDRVSVGFPGVIRRGVVLTAPHLGTEDWRDFPLAKILGERLQAPVRILNDASVQGYAVISGAGVECVITLGTGVGFALYENGVLSPHVELGRYPVHKNTLLDDYLGNVAFRKISKKHWNRRVRRVLGYLETLVNYDVLYIGGGNAKHINLDLPDNVKIVPNEAGVTGGIKLWDAKVDYAFAET
ncbi:MAG: ROK family protein [Methylobacteriaceae bacterium]|nr:ROK family protein [Methylobacteriaceae bacterium]MBV9395414.1 ROK family protein [Methylobacteriaceae bacterium]